ncbi:MAG: amino acid adenylation domain-containing protein [Ferruginibacter sp.]
MESSFNIVIDLLYLAKQNDVEIILNEDRLQLKIPEGKQVDQQLIEDIRNNKQAIIEYLGNDNFKSASVSENHNIITAFDREKTQWVSLSFSQERMWFIDQLEGSVQYHVPALLRLTGNLNTQALEHAFKTIISRHEILRTIYKEENGTVLQAIREKDDWQMEFVEGNVYCNEEHLQQYAGELVRKPFNLADDYMLRATLIKVTGLDHILVVTVHHIASDAWSLSVLIREIVELYGSFIEKRAAQLLASQLQYADFAVWQRSYLQGNLLDKKLGYWQSKLDGAAPLRLPTDFERPAINTSKGASATFTVDKELSFKLKELSQQQNASLFMTMLAIFKVLLYRYSGQSDISVGTSIANRPQKEIENLVGFFVNTISLRDEVNGDSNFVSLLQQVRSTTMEAYDNQDVPFEKVVELVAKERSGGKSSLFQVMLVLQNTGETPELKLGNLTFSTLAHKHATSKFDITFFLTETPGGIQGSLEYSTELYTADTITQMVNHYKQLMHSAVSNPLEKVGLLSMLSKEEENNYTKVINTAAVEYPSEKSLIDLFEEQVTITPGNSALIFESETITYQQLNERSNQLAHALIEKGVKSGMLVPLFVERSADMIVGMMGILKAGGAYVPVDTDFPAERVNYMLTDIAATVIVCSSATYINLPETSGLTVLTTSNQTDHSKENPEIKPAANDTAYVIYTSGSTGKPKGVMISHRNLADYYFGLKKFTPVSTCKSFALVSSIATDLGNTVIYASLLSGGALHLFTKETISNIELLQDYFETNAIDCLKIVPSHWQALSTEADLLLPRKLIIFGGEALPAAIAATINAESDCTVVNHYGPTETTIGKLLHAVKEGNDYSKTIPIGKPFSNTSIYILTKELQLCPTGVAGQLFIAGDGLSQGYWNNIELTKEKFIHNPFVLDQGSLMYGTGDQVKYQKDGNVMFLGRVDDQVKIRGYRIELGEIESAINQIAGVSQAVVLAGDDVHGNKRLEGYIVPDGYFNREGILDALRQNLPDYMVPGILVSVESMPLMANGKIDRKALAEMEAKETGAGAYVAPGNEVEVKLAAIWEEILEVEQVGVNDDFFELGGHSLLAVRLVSAIRKAFEIDFPLNDVFIYPTIAGIATNISAKSNNSKDTSTTYKYLVPVKTGGDKIPLYIICGGGGTATRFKRFAGMLDDDQPVFALQPIVDNAEHKIHVSMEEIANKFIEEIMIGNPDGPYALSGHCVGGVIAFEMAKQLEAKGKKVHLLAMFDTFIRIIKKDPPATLKNFYNIPLNTKRLLSKAMLKLDFEIFLLRRHTKKAINYKAKYFKTILRNLKSKPEKGNLDFVGLEIFNESSEVYRAASRNYKLERYEGEMLMFYAKERYYFTDVNNNIRYKKIYINEYAKKVWQQYATSIIIYEIDGDHSDIFESTHGNQFANLLQEQLNRPVKP